MAIGAGKSSRRLMRVSNPTVFKRATWVKSPEALARTRHFALCLSDQVLFSATTFLIVLLFGRLLRPDDYGAFSIVFAMFLLVVVVHYGLILEPMLILGATLFENARGKYVLAVLVCNVVFALPIGGLVALGLAVSQGFQPSVVKAALWLMITSPVILTSYTLRRACYVFDRPDIAVYGSVLYCGTSLLVVYFLNVTGLLSAWTVFVALAFGAMICAGVLWGCLKLSKDGYPGKQLFYQVAKEHWIYGKWATGCLFLNWLFFAAYFPVLGRSWGLGYAGVLRVFDNFAQPIPQVLTAVSLVFLPRLAKLSQTESSKTSLLALKVTVIALGVCFLYFGSLWVLGPRLLVILYKDKTYSQYIWVIPWMSAVMLAKVVTDFGVGLVFRASRQPEHSFAILRVGALITICASLPMCAFWGVGGAVAGRLLAVTGEMICVIWYVGRLKGKQYKRMLPILQAAE